MGSVREHVLLAREEEVSSLLLLLEKRVKMIMTPWEDLFFVINNLLLGEEPSIEDFILLVGTSVAFIAFILWCCFPIEPKDSLGGSEHLTTQAADAVYDAKYKQLGTRDQAVRQQNLSRYTGGSQDIQLVIIRIACHSFPSGHSTHDEGKTVERNPS